MDLNEQLQRYDRALASLPANEADLGIELVTPARQLDWSPLADLGVNVLADDDVMRSVRLMLTRVEDHERQLFASSVDGHPGHYMISAPQHMAYFHGIWAESFGNGWPRLLVPMFADGAGNNLCIDLSSTSPTYGWLFDVDHETREIKAVAPSLARLVASTANLIEIGLLTCDEYGDFDWTDKAPRALNGVVLGLPESPDIRPGQDPGGYEFALVTVEKLIEASAGQIDEYDAQIQASRDADKAQRAAELQEHLDAQGDRSRFKDADEATLDQEAAADNADSGESAQPSIIDIAADAFKLIRGFKRAAEDGINAAKKAWDEEQKKP